MSIYRVLVVDDDKLSREFLAHATEALGYQALAVSSGAAALEALNQSSFDLVLTDLRMPEMNGLELVERLPGLGEDRADARDDVLGLDAVEGREGRVLRGWGEGGVLEREER